MSKPVTKTRKKKQKRNIPKGVVHIHSSFNNTIITISDEKGAVVSWGSSGSAGFKGSRKSTPYAAQIAAEKAVGACKDFGMSSVDVIAYFGLVGLSHIFYSDIWIDIKISQHLLASLKSYSVDICQSHF